MKTITRIISLAMLLALLLTLAPSQPVHSARQESPPASILNDAFGHYLNSGAPFTWTDIQGVGSKLSFFDDDNAVILRSLPFAFPFYEFDYWQVQISIDGVIYLGGGDLPAVINIRPLPFESPPNAVIAPLWEDLALVLDNQHSDGEIWIKTDGTAPNRTFTIQWCNVYRLGSGTPLTFQAVLKETGDIVFNYFSIGDVVPDIPIGIEDSDGIDGIQYIYEVDELTSGKSVYITRPGPGARLKAFPVFQGGFLETQKAWFEVIVRNTGTIEDNYALSKEILTGNPGWQVRFLDGEQEITQTGIIPSGAEFKVTVGLSSSYAPVAGDFAKVRIGFQSTVSESKNFNVYIQGAVPAEFAKVYERELPTPAASVLLRSQAIGETKVIPTQSQDNLALLRVSGGRYLVASDNEESGGYSNVEFTLIDTSSSSDYITHMISDNSLVANETVRDLAPSMAVTPDGNIGIIFIRERIREEVITPELSRYLLNSNVWFAAINPNGLLEGPYRITNNTAYNVRQAKNVDFYASPAITATADNRFTLVWIRHKILESERSVSDLFMTNLSSIDLAGGGGINPPLQLTNGEMDYQNYYDPVITALRGGGSALVASVYKADWMEYYLRIYYLDNYGSYISQMNLERGMQGIHSDILQLRNGNILLGYSTPDFRGIGYALITPDKSVYRCQLPISGGDTLDYVSITTDPAGNGVLTWADRLTSRHYYTLISPNPPPELHACFLLTPPMIYGHWPVGDTIRSHYNQNSTTAPLGSPNLFIPLIGQ
jgi:hypothetical protein